MPRELNAQEDDLLRRAVRGDEEAFLQIYRAHQATLYRYALRMTGRPWAAEELVQEVFLTLLHESGRFDPSRGALGAFLFGIGRNHVRKHLERSPDEVPLDENAEPPQTAAALNHANGNRLANPAGWAEQRQKSEQLHRALLEIPEEFREAIVLCDLEEQSYEEAALLLCCPIGTVRSRLHRGRALLMARMEFLRGQPRKAVAR
jgi:RNA polymerase sigma-70 factor (ECF subfamily)